MSELLSYKCPCCGGALEFKADIQKIKCPYCDTEFEAETLKSYDDILKNDNIDDMNWDNSPGSEWSDSESQGLCSFICNSCGGEIICDENTVATGCPYCDNPVVMTGRVSGVLKPDYVIPFKVDKEAAKEALKNHIKGKTLLPKVFKDENHIDEIKGVYVPFWLFDAEADAGIRYRANRIRHWFDSKYNYTETSHYLVLREGSIGFERVPVDGSEKMPDDLMESIEPYNPEDMVDFQTAYLAGYLADKYDVDSEKCIPRANQRIKNSTEQIFASTVVGYTGVITEHSSIRLTKGSTGYALYPVWLLNTTWQGQKYTFAMNGQTGKFVGDLPVDKVAYHKWLWSLTGICSAVVFGLMYLFWWL